MKPRISVVPGTYRRLEGFKVRGTDWAGRSIRVFCRTREGAEFWRVYLKTGDRAAGERAEQALRDGQ